MFAAVTSYKNVKFVVYFFEKNVTLKKKEMAKAKRKKKAPEML